MNVAFILHGFAKYATVWHKRFCSERIGTYTLSDAHVYLFSDTLGVFPPAAQHQLLLPASMYVCFPADVTFLSLLSMIY